MYYTERLQWIRDCKNITQKELAEYLGIKQQQYARYEKGVNVMPVTYLGPICKFLDISADYLLGLINDPIPLSQKEKLTS
ncbi:TPA: helix-turn-helix transcriptional regulator [Candidatus Ventrenecus stercoripullorum]|nr:helix-turn-helix transcriptional regulator [Candidatus Ventrenecus stercoripullorum]